MSIGLVQQLREFVSKAQKLGKYPANTAGALASVINLVEKGLTEAEPQTVEYLEEHADEIFHRQLDKLNISEGSLRAYGSRLRRLLSDFQLYGQEPKKLLDWKPKMGRRANKDKNMTVSVNQEVHQRTPNLSMQPAVGSNGKTAFRTLVWSIRPDVSIQIQLPADLNRKDGERLKKLIDLETELTPSLA